MLPCRSRTGSGQKIKSSIWNGPRDYADPFTGRVDRGVCASADPPPYGLLRYAIDEQAVRGLQELGG